MPEGAEVFGPDGSLVGNTPVDIRKPADGEDPVEYRIHLADYEERTFTVGSRTVDTVTLTMEQERRAGRGGRRRGGTRQQTDQQQPETGLRNPPGGTGTVPATTGVSENDLHDPFARQR